MRSVFISAGEQSGDLHSSALMKEMKLLPQIIQVMVLEPVFNLDLIGFLLREYLLVENMHSDSEVWVKLKSLLKVKLKQVQAVAHLVLVLSV